MIPKWDLIPYVRGTGLCVGQDKAPFKHMMHFGAGQAHLAAADAFDFVCLRDNLTPELVRLAWDKLKPGGHLIVWAPLEGYVNVPEALGERGFDWVWHDEDAQGALQVFVRTPDGEQRECMPQRPERCAAVVRPGGRAAGYGDALWASSVIAQLHGMGYHVTVYVDEAGHEALQHDPHVGRFIVDSYAMIGRDDIATYWEHEAGRYDRWVNLSQAVETSLLIDPSQLASLWPKHARHLQCNRNYLEATHAVAGLPYVPKQKFYPTALEQVLAQDMRGPGPCVVIADTGTTKTKWWPHMGQLAQALVDAYPELRVCVLGEMRSEYPEHERIRLFGVRRPWRQAAALAVAADVVVGQETGLLNAVAFEPNRKVVLLSHSSAEQLTRDWVNTVAIEPERTPCYPCHILHFNGFDRCYQDISTGAALCQANISVGRVAEAVDRALALERELDAA